MSTLFPELDGPQSGVLAVPDIISTALRDGAALGISISGGKDGQAMLNVVTTWYRAQGFTGLLFALHADLGRAEWPQTAAHVEATCKALDVPLRVVQRPKGDLLTRFEERMEATRTSGAPFWPDSQNRYCTSHLKSGPLDTELRRPFWPSATNRYCTSDLKRGPIDTELRTSEVIISAEGVRAQESPARARKSAVEVRAAITAASKNPVRNLAGMTPEAAYEVRQPWQRLALNWRPLLHWNEADVWRACGTSQSDLARRRLLYRAGAQEEALVGFPAHPAYVMGNTRLSCALCILGSESDLTNGANQNPETYRAYLELEQRGGSTFKHGWSLAQLNVTGEAARVRDEVLNQ